MDLKTLKREAKGLLEKLNASYEPTDEKPLIKIAELAVILPALGLFYLWEYFDKFKIDYFLFFDLKDAISVLYQNLMPVIYVGTLLTLALPVLLPSLIKKYKENREGEQQVTDQADKKLQIQLSNFTIFLLVCLILVGAYVIMDVYKFELLTIVIFLIFAGISIYLYLYPSKNIGLGAVIICAFLYAEVKATRDAKSAMDKKAKFNIVLSGQSQVPILKENDRCRYLMYKSSNYYFIKDDCRKIVYVYSIAGGEVVSATVP